MRYAGLLDRKEGVVMEQSHQTSFHADDVQDMGEMTRSLAKARETLLELLVELDDLECRICPFINAEYQQKLGTHEQSLFEAQTSLARIKRKLELVKASIAKGMQPCLSRIQTQLDFEFKDSDRHLAQRRTYLNHVGTLGQKFVMPGDNDELDEIHRTLVERLHPDLHTEDPFEPRDHMFAQMRASLTNGDMTELHDLEVISRYVNEPVKERPLPTTELQDRLVMYETAIDFTKKSIVRLKNNYPYTEHLLLADEDKVAQNIHDIDELVDEYHAEEESYFLELQSLLDS